MAAPTVSCATCGRDNDPMSRFCIDCGKPLTASSARIAPAYSGAISGQSATDARIPLKAMPVPESAAPSRVTEIPGGQPCPKCSKLVDPSMPFCGHCGTRITTSVAAGTCWSCGAGYLQGVDTFCARCGSRVGQRVSMEVNEAFGTLVGDEKPSKPGPKLSVLDENGAVKQTFVLDQGEAVIGRGEADIKFDDVYLSPLHARFELKEGALWLRDLGSRNGTWIFIEGPAKLTDCDVILVGSQLLRFRRLGYPGPHPPEADSTRRMGSLVPSADVAVLEQLRADGSVRDTFHLSPARTVLMGRESGDWVFPYDQTMSGKHAEIRSQDAEFFVHDAGSRNGVALSVRGDRQINPATRVLIGDQVLRVESLGL